MLQNQKRMSPNKTGSRLLQGRRLHQGLSHADTAVGDGGVCSALAAEAAAEAAAAALASRCCPQDDERGDRSDGPRWTSSPYEHPSCARQISSQQQGRTCSSRPRRSRWKLRMGIGDSKGGLVTLVVLVLHLASLSLALKNEFRE